MMRLPEIEEALNELDAQAEALNAHDVRESIMNVRADLSEPAGKENARMAICELRDRIAELTPKHSQAVLSSLSSASHSDEAVA